MKLRQNERGELNILLVPVILLAVLFVGAASFAAWAYAGRQDYKNNSDKKVAAAVAANKKVVQAEDAKKYAEEAKQPLKTYSGPDAYGSLQLSYPKTWSVYMATGSSSTPIDGYLNPDVVPSISDQASTFALRVQVVQQSYATVLQSFSSSVKTGKATVSPYKLPKMQDVIGSRVDGQLTPKKQGSMVILPVRDKTLKIWTESSNFKADFDNNILANFTFSP